MFLLADLTQYRKKWVKTVKLACFAAGPVIAVEIISAPFNTDWLLPLIHIIGVPVYLVGSLALLIITGIFMVLTHYLKSKDGKNK